MIKLNDFFFYSLSYVSVLLHHNIINQSNCAWSSYVTMAMPACTVKNKTSVLLLKFRESKNLTAWRSSPWENRYLGKGKLATFVLEGDDEGSPLSAVSVSWDRFHDQVSLPLCRVTVVVFITDPLRSLLSS